MSADSRFRLRHRIGGVATALSMGALLVVAQQPPASAMPRALPQVLSTTPGATPFLAEVTIGGVLLDSMRSVTFSIAPQVGATAKAMTATYQKAYLASHGLTQSSPTPSITIPVYGLYASSTHHSNQVTFEVSSTQGTSSVTTTIETTPWSDSSGGLYTTELEVLKARDAAVRLPYSYLFLKGVPMGLNPLIMDTDGEVRWVGTTSLVRTPASAFAGRSFYLASGTKLLREELDGTVTTVRDFAGIKGVTYLQHHSMDTDPMGLLLEANTSGGNEATILQVTTSGRVLATFDLAAIVRTAMRAGGDDPNGFVSPFNDWFHNNSATYWAQRNELVVSSRENFVLGINYSTKKIDWILGDPTKAWHQYPSLRALALGLERGTPPPIGQHSVSITSAGQLLLFDNGEQSSFEFPAGSQRTSSAPRSYSLNFSTRTASQSWTFRNGRSIWSPICGSVAKVGASYLIDYSSAYGGPELVGLGADNAVAFDYRLPGDYTFAWNAQPIALSGLSFSS